MLTETMLRQAAAEAGEALLDSLPERETTCPPLSPAFEGRMRRILRRGSHPARYRVLRRAAGFLLALLVGGAVWLGVDTAAQRAAFGWVGERLQNVQHYVFDGPTGETAPAPGYRLTEPPEGYRARQTETFDTGQYVIYTDDREDCAIFSYTLPSETPGDGLANFQVGAAEGEEVLINESPGTCFIDETGRSDNLLAWKDEETGALLYVSGPLDRKTLLRMAESVVREEGAVPGGRAGDGRL